MIVWVLNWWGAALFCLRHGFWCAHTDWSPWELYDLGRAKHRHCWGCGWWESTG